MLISIITINYNKGEGLEHTIRSVQEQTYRDIEHIVIDGASNDNSVNVIKSLEDKIAYWVSEPDKGIYNAMNKGIAHATGEYCLFLNSGDKLFKKDSIENVIGQELNADIVSCDLINDDDPNHGYKMPPDEITPAFMSRSALPHPSTLIKTSIMKHYGYREDFRIISDWVFFYEALIRDNATYQHICLPLSVFYTDGISSRNKTQLIEEHKRYYNSIFSERVLKEKESQAYNDFIDSTSLSKGYSNMLHFITKVFCWLQRHSRKIKHAVHLNKRFR